MEYLISRKQIATAVGAIIGFALATFLVKLYRHRRAMMGLVSQDFFSVALVPSPFSLDLLNFVSYYLTPHLDIAIACSLSISSFLFTFLSQPSF